MRRRVRTVSIACVAVLTLTLLACAGTASPWPWTLGQTLDAIKLGGVLAAAACSILALFAILWKHALKRPVVAWWRWLSEELEIDALVTARRQRRRDEHRADIEDAIGPRLTRIEQSITDVNNWKALAHLTAVDLYELRGAFYHLLDRHLIDHPPLGPRPSLDPATR